MPHRICYRHFALISLLGEADAPTAADPDVLESHNAAVACVQSGEWGRAEAGVGHLDYFTSFMDYC